MHVLHIFIFHLYVFDFLFILLPYSFNLTFHFIALIPSLSYIFVEFCWFSAVLLINLVVSLFVIFVESPVCVCLIATSRLPSNLLFQKHYPFLQFSLLNQQLCVNLTYYDLTSDMLGIWEALISSPLRAEWLEWCSGFPAEGGRCFLGVNSLLYLFE